MNLDIPETDLSERSLEDILIAIMKATDKNGIPIAINPTKIINWPEIQKRFGYRLIEGS